MVGFHANDAIRCEKFISDGTLIISEDLEYLGTGMYFWDSYSQANWWKTEKEKERIVSAVINTDDEDHFLNIQDPEYEKYLARMYDKAAKALSFGIKQKLEKYHLTLDQCVGLKLDLIFNSYKSFNQQIDVIKGIYTKKSKKDDFFYNTMFSRECVEIHCVRHEKAIVSRRWADGK